MADYTRVRPLGAGGMGTVHVAVQKGLERQVAVKLLPRGAELDESLVARFTREVKLISQLAHPNIVRVFDWGQLDGQLFFAMELVTGQDLTREPPEDFARP